MKIISVAFTLLLLLVPALRADGPLRVTSLSTILTEITEKLGGDHVKVTGLVKPGIDPHDYEPVPDDIAVMGESQVILASGKHIEGYLAKLPQSSGSKGVFVEVGDRLPSLKMQPEEGEKHGAVDRDGKIEDPHWWNSVVNVKLATTIVRDEFMKADPANASEYKRSAEVYEGELNALQKWARLKIAELPRDQRKLVTSHDAFHYFAREFGFTIYTIEGLSTEDEPSNRKVIEIIDTIKKEHVKAIFGEFGNNPKVLEAITRDSGAKIGGELYADGLGGDVTTYEAMVKHNLTTIVDGLK